MDCVAAIVTNIMMGFGGGRSTLSLALDLKRAFNAVLPGELISELKDLEIPGRILNFVSFIVKKEYIPYVGWW